MLRLKNIFYLGIITSVLLLASCGGDDESDSQPAPSISSFTPTSGEIGATVTISGNNFSTTIQNNQVKFGTINATVTAATATSITTTVPTGVSTSKISVSVNGKTATSTTDFTLISPPIITNFSPTGGKEGTIVTITGSNFSTTLADNVVKFNGTTATVTAATATSLTVSVPTGAATGKIAVQVKGINTNSTSDFIIFLQPTISGFSPTSGSIGNTIVINGTNFSTTLANTVVKINGVQATVNSGNATQLFISVPAGATSGKITVETNGFQAVSSTLDFIVFGTITTKANLPQIRYHGISFSIGDKGYVGLGIANSTLSKDLWQYNPTTNTWTQMANFPGTARYAVTGFSIGDKGYVGLGETNTTTRNKDFYEYNPATNTWTKKADFAGSSRRNATAFVIGNKAYVGLGNESNATSPVLVKDFYEYNPSTDSWIQKNDFAGTNRQIAEGFSIGATGYVLGGLGASNVTSKDIWSYNATTDAWTLKASNLSLFYGYSTFVIDNKAYLYYGASLFVYDSVNNIVISQVSPSGGGGIYGMSFTIGGKGYFGGGFVNSLGSSIDVFYEFTPR
jgi:N-acetylneuraminic acid mutarotase